MTFSGHRRWPTHLAAVASAIAVPVVLVQWIGVGATVDVGLRVIGYALLVVLVASPIRWRVDLHLERNYILIRLWPLPFRTEELGFDELTGVSVADRVPSRHRVDLLWRRGDPRFVLRWDRALVLHSTTRGDLYVTLDDPEAAASALQLALARPPVPAPLGPDAPDPHWFGA